MMRQLILQLLVLVKSNAQNAKNSLHGEPNKSKSVKYAKLKDDTDQIVAVAPIKLDDVVLISQNGYALRFNIEEVPVVGAKAAGVKAMNLKEDDILQSAFICNTSSFYLLTQRGS